MKLTLVISVDQEYFHKATAFGLWKSLRKNWKNADGTQARVCILCVGFNDEWISHDNPVLDYEIASCNIEDLKCYRKGWPSNRDLYFCSESGEFLDYFKFTNDEIIIHLDGDMVLQRPLNEAEIATFEHIEDGEVAMAPYTLPYANLRDEVYKLKPRRGYEKINEEFPGRLGAYDSMCAGLVVATKNTWMEIKNKYIDHVNKVVACFDHHAASQWLFNYIVGNDYNLIELSNVIHNAAWFTDTDAIDGDYLYTTSSRTGNRSVTLFNHTKFAKEYKY